MAKNGIVCLVLLYTATLAVAKEEIPANVVAGKQVEAEAKLTVGTKLVGIWDKKNYLVEVIEVKKNNEIRIHWIGFDKSEDVDVPPSTLYYIADTTQTRKVRTSPLPKEYQGFDKNGDGQIGLYEWDRAKYAEFKKLDKNRDGFLTPQELAAKGVVVASAAATPNATAPATTPAAGTPATGTPAAGTAAPGTAAAAPLADPGNLDGYIGMIGQTFTFTVTGATEGEVVGTGTFATNSRLATAAVHAGILKAGATGPVTASIIASPTDFKGSTANGVTSNDGPAYPAAFTLK